MALWLVVLLLGAAAAKETPVPYSDVPLNVTAANRQSVTNQEPTVTLRAPGLYRLTPGALADGAYKITIAGDYVLRFECNANLLANDPFSYAHIYNTRGAISLTTNRVEKKFVVRINSNTIYFSFATNAAQSAQWGYTPSLACNIRVTPKCYCSQPAANTGCNRITDGQASCPQRHPHQARLEICPTGSQCRLCGATLIDASHVLTAAHCFDGLSDGQYSVTVQLGQHNNQAEYSTTVGYDRVRIHESYYSTSDNKRVNDIALIYLPNQVRYSDSVRPACLYRSSGSTLINKLMTISGYGTTESNVPESISVNIREAQVTVVADSTSGCQKSLGVNQSNDPSRICAIDLDQSTISQGIAYQDACQGDSGGPLTIAQSGKVLLAGITSYGKGCGGIGFGNGEHIPGVYTEVSGYTSWIENNAGLQCYV